MIVKSWSILVLASLLFVILACVLTQFVMRLLRSNREQILATGALVPEQQLIVREPGDVVLLLETPRLGSAYWKFEFDIREEETGQTTKLKYDYMRAQGAVRGVTTTRVPLGRIMAHQAGAFLVRVSGLEADKDYSGSRVMFSRPYLGRMVAQILGIVICGIGMLLSLLFASWQIFPLQGGN